VSRRSRKHSAGHYAKSILGKVWRHSSNDGRRVRAVVRAVAWQAYKRSVRRPLILRVGKYRVRCHSDSGSAANVIYFTERFDPVEFSLLDAYLRPGDSVVDAGANIGLYSLWMAGLVGRNGSVEAFEPVPKTVARLRENVELNHLEEVISIYPVAVSNSAGWLEFYVDLDVTNGVVPAVDPASSLSRTMTVRAATLSDSLSAGPHTLAKVDVEGAELAALGGWSERLERGDPPVILMEMLEGQLQKQGTSKREVARFLADRDYDLRVYDPKARVLGPIPGLEALHGNVVAVHRPSEAFVSGRLTSNVLVVDDDLPGPT
jgi:FkbM family methyltransferase